MSESTMYEVRFTKYEVRRELFIVIGIPIVSLTWQKTEFFLLV
jgi:hypothetical protein